MSCRSELKTTLTVALQVIVGMFQTAGKVALITGALGGLGQPCVRALLRNEVRGVMMTDRSDDKVESFVKKLDAEYGVGKLAFAKADVVKTEELRCVFDNAVGHFGQLDIVINNAGVFEENAVDVNLGSALTSTHLAMQEYLPKYKKDSEAVILNVSSLAGLLPFSLVPVYTATKAALVSFGRCMKSNKDSSVKVVTLCPGFTDTPMLGFLHVLPQEEVVAKSGGLINMLQSPDFVGEATVEVIKAGSNGSVWVVNNGRPPFEVDFKECQDCLKKQILDKTGC